MDLSMRQAALKPLNSNVACDSRKLRKWSTASHLNGVMMDTTEHPTKGTKCISENRHITNTIRQTLKKVNSNEEVLNTNDQWVEPEELEVELFENFPALPPDVINLDAKRGDGLCPYPRQMYAYLRTQEEGFLTPKNFLKGKPADMRSLLVDWLTEVQVYESLFSESLHLAVALIDSFLAVQHVEVGRMQLLGIAAFFVASKFVERFPPTARSLCYYTDNSFQPVEMLRMEQNLLKLFNFRVNRPLPCHFLTRCLDASIDIPRPLLRTVRITATYLLELVLMHVSASSFRPSERAAAAVLVAKALVCPDLPPVTPSFEHYAGYTFDELKECSKMLVMVLRDEVVGLQQNQSITKKFSKAKYDEISRHPALHNRRHITSLLKEFS